jgi:uncharacterized protein (DUF433 family)
MVAAVAHNAECGWLSDVGVPAARTPPMRVADNARGVQFSVQPDQRALTAALPRCWSGGFCPISSSHRVVSSPGNGIRHRPSGARGGERPRKVSSLAILACTAAASTEDSVSRLGTAAGPRRRLLASSPLSWRYRERVSRLERITSDPAVCHGQPTIRGLRYTVETVLELLSAGMTIDEVLADYPDLEREDILAALEFGARAAGRRRVVPLSAA